MPPCAAGTTSPSRPASASVAQSATSMPSAVALEPLQAFDRDLLLEDAAREVADRRSDLR